ncbi:hypothetical protein [Campylobacter coli]|uniref:hypothetical protein n=1 Tax=Campylobacter coli TaxID=195 RepID=UPI003DA05884
MKSTLFIFLASILDKFSTIISVIAIIFAVGVCVLTIFYFFYKFDDIAGSEKIAAIILKTIKIFIPISIITGSIAILTPSKQTAYLMAGAYIGNQVATSEFVNNRLEKIIEIIDLNLDKQIKELQGFKK